jgi:biopolymer transport protein ExbD
MRRCRRTEEAVLSQINVTNLVDVTITTLIIYMLIAPIMEHGIDVRLPQSSPLTMHAPDPVTISVSRKGVIFINNTQVTREQLRGRLKDIARFRSDQAVVIRGDDDIPYKEIVGILDMAKTSGLVNLGLATRVAR